MECLPIILKKGRPFIDTLSDHSSLQREICPREKFISCIDVSRHLIIHLLSDDSQTAVVESHQFIKSQWIVPCRTQQESVVDLKLECKSELVAVTSTLDCHWYSVSNGSPPSSLADNDMQQDEVSGAMKVELLASLKKDDLSTKLRKLDFPDVLESVTMLGSEGGKILLLFNSFLVCHFLLDQEFGRIALVGCYVLQLSLHHYQDTYLPTSPGPVVSHVFISLLLFALTTDGIVFIYNASNGASIGVVNLLDYCQYSCSRQPDSNELLSEVTKSEFERLSVSPDLNHLAVSSSANHILLVNLPDYFQTFPHHYHPDFSAGPAKTRSGSKTMSQFSSIDLSKEEEDDQRMYGGLLPHQHAVKFSGPFAGNHAWTCRLEKLNKTIDNFNPDMTKYLNFQQSTQLAESSNVAIHLNKLESSQPTGVELLNALPTRKAWYEDPQSITFGGQNTQDSSSTQFITGMSKSSLDMQNKELSEERLTSSKQYQNHCILPAVNQENSSVVQVDFVSGLVVAYYGHHPGGNEDHVNVVPEPHSPVKDIAVYHTESKSYSYARLPQLSWLVRTSLPDQLIYFVNEQSLSVMTFNISQEEFVGKVLMFGSASVAEEVCHLNRWDKCSLPINALETALELRQLDTLAFFLRSRDNDSNEDHNQETDIPSLPPLPPDQLDTVVQLLTGAIRRNCQEEHHCQFASQLLIMTLGFIIRMIKSEVIREGFSAAGSVASEQKSTDENGPVSLTNLASYIQQLRSFLPKAMIAIAKRDEEEVREKQRGDTECEDYVAAFLDKAIVNDWDKLNPKEVIKDALLRGCLPLAQAYLFHRKPEDFDRQPMVTLLRGRTLLERLGSQGYGFSTAAHQGVSIAEALDDHPHGHNKPFSPDLSFSFSYDASFRSMQVTAIGYMIESLQKRNIKLAKSILVHLGLDVYSSLRHVCFYTLDRDLRDFLSKELNIQKQMTEPEMTALEYLHILERYYPFQSYDQALELHSKQTSSTKMVFQATVLPVMPGIMKQTTAIPSLGNLQDLYPETFGGDHTLSWDLPVHSSTSQTALYLQAPLAAVLSWDNATRQRLLFEGFILNGQAEGTDCERLVNRRHIFDYYVSHSDVASTVRFLASKIPTLENPTLCPPFIISLCSAMPHATPYLHNTLLDELARNGVFIPSELNDFPQFLYRLGRVHSLFSAPHPLSKTAGQITQCETDEDYNQAPNESAIISVESFHRKFLLYLIDNRFYSLMYHYLDSYGLGLSESSITLLGLDKHHPWVDVLLQYRRAALNPLDPSVIFQASLSCGHLLLSSDNIQHQPTVMGMLRNGRTLMAAATLMFAPVPVEEATSKNNSNQPWYAESATLQLAFAAYPSLQAAVFPPSPTSLSPAQSQDISVYELLQDNVPFDISHLFKWQDTNTVTCGHDETIINPLEMPHFSSAALTEKFALSEHLDYVYYLRRGQPSFAFANFVASKLLGRSNTEKRINCLKSQVYRLALHDFTILRLGSACAALMEMLGRDSTCLRVDLQCANRIAKYGQEQKTIDFSKSQTEDSQYKKIVHHFCRLHQTNDKTIASLLLQQLESSTEVMITESGVEDCGLEAEECWQLVQSFCHCHQLLPSVAFLSVCAVNSQWLPLLCHAQLHCISTQRVLMVVDKSFTSPSVKEHLILAISSMDTTEQPSSPLFVKGENVTEKSRSRKRRSTSSSRNPVVEKANTIVSTQPDLRAKFYSRVGLQKEVTPQPDPLQSQEGGEIEEEGQPKTQVPISTGQERAAASPVPERVLPPPLLESDLPTDLFSAIFKSQSRDCQWQSLLAHSIALQRPLLAILAACYEDSSALDCTCAWLFSTLGSSMFEKLINLLIVNGEISEPEDQLIYCAKIQWRVWSTLDLSLMLISAMQQSPSPAAHFSLAFHYFDENSPLVSFLKFHEEFVLRNDYESCKKYLQEFRLRMDNCKSYGFGGLIGDVCWVEQVTSSMASHMLVMCPTPFERSHLLELLSESNFGEHFKCSVLDFSDLHQMSQVLSEAGLSSDAAFTVSEHFSTPQGSIKSLSEIYSVRVRVDTDYVLELLLERGQFDIARKYASIVMKSTASQVTVKEAEYNLKQLRKSSYWEYEHARLNFWHQCNSTFHEAGVQPESAAEFFHSVVVNSEETVEKEKLAPTSITPMERALLLALALKWRKEKENLTSEQIRDFEREIWLSHIRSAMEDMESPNQSKLNGSPLPYVSQVNQSPSALFSFQPGHTSLLSSLSISAQEHFKGRRQLSEFMLPDNVSVALEGKSRTTLTRKEGEAFDMMLGRLMNAGLLSQARELAATFEHDSPDLTIVLCCIQLCQGKLTPSQLTKGVLSLVSARPPRHLNDPSSSSLDDQTHSPQVSELIRMMNNLSDRAKYARTCCDCITTCFRIALALNLSYVSIVTTEPFDILSQLLSSKTPDCLVLASKLIITCNLEPKEVARFLLECITSSLQSQHGRTGNHTDSPKARVYQHEMSSSQFHELAQLTSDPTILGNLLLEMAKSLGSSEDESKQNKSIQVELLIRAHDSYTLGCSVDGIGDVLVVAHDWVQKFVKGKHYRLMVRMLTGISRYHEMSYIIGLLIDHDQFESLVHTGIEKEEQLRAALIEYLRKHGGDTEKLQMVALKFGMLRELAKTNEEQARRNLATIKPKHLASNNAETVKKLKVIFDYFKDAASTYSQEDCLNNAEHCLSQARLVALQLSVLNQGKQVINLEPRAVLKYMEEQPFTEALIVSDAYKQCIWADWVNPLYKRVVIGGDFRYLSEYRTAFPLTPTLFSEMASKYQRDRERPYEATTNMKRFLTELKNLTLKQKLAMELGMSDLVQTKYDAGYMSDIQRL